MKCEKCNKIWKNVDFKLCPYCGTVLVEEKLTVKLDGPAQVIKDIVDGKYGSDTIHNRTRCGALFSDLMIAPDCYWLRERWLSALGQSLQDNSQ